MTEILERWINNPSNVWIVLVLGGLILILGALFGFMRGWRSALYFAIWNVIGLILCVFITKPIGESIINGKFDDEYTAKVVSIIAPYIIPIIIIPALMIFNILSLFPYIFLRKIIRGKDQMTGGSRKPVIGERLFGIGIGTLNSLPLMILCVNAATITTGSTAITRMNKIGFKAVTFGQFPDMVSNVSRIYSAAMLVASPDGIEEAAKVVTGILGGGDISDDKTEKWLKENHKKLEDLMNWEDGYTLLKEVVKEDFDPKMFDNINDFNWPAELNDYKFNLTASAQKALTNAMLDLWKSSTAENKPDDAEMKQTIKDYIAKITK